MFKKEQIVTDADIEATAHHILFNPKAISELKIKINKT